MRAPRLLLSVALVASTAFLRCTHDYGYTGAGCATSADCLYGGSCADGACTGGCDSDADCISGEVCGTNGCEPGCRVDADCPGETCVRGLLGRTGLCGHPCSSGCPEGSYCLEGFLDICRELPPAVPCGPLTCLAVVADLGPPIPAIALAPCCAGVEGCGVEVGAIVVGGTCQALQGQGSLDPACADSFNTFARFPGCRRANSACGVRIADLGCVELPRPRVDAGAEAGGP